MEVRSKLQEQQQKRHAHCTLWCSVRNVVSSFSNHYLSKKVERLYIDVVYEIVFLS